ncbi:MAG: hypothetical protein NTY90_02335 [Candidatus Micrarchaeota archaeon]|nr:hypothetical protein [Candidatus Micrarchaeota archaeon]
MVFLKGFIGPLGDDIPSIFPIVAGILLFISVVVYSVYFVQAKNEYLDTRKAALGLAYIATKSGVTTTSEFNAECNNVVMPYAETRGVRFAIVLKKFCTEINLDSNPFDSEPRPPSADAGAVCTTRGIGPTKLMEAGSPNSEYMPSDSVILNYPIAVYCPDEGSVTRGLGMITIMVWKKKGRLEEASGMS